MFWFELPRTMPANRRVALAVSLVVHVVALVLLFLATDDTPQTRPERGMSVIDTVSDRDVEAKPMQEAEVPEVDVTTRPGETLFPVELPQLAQEAASSGPEGEACGIAAVLQADLVTDAAARAEIAAIPFDARSVANAIVLWMGSPEHVRPVLPATDAAILRRLQTLPAACLDVDQAGPDFIYASIDDRTISIAIGSGRWRWRNYFDLLSTPVRPNAPVERISGALGYSWRVQLGE